MCTWGEEKCPRAICTCISPKEVRVYWVRDTNVGEAMAHGPGRNAPCPCGSGKKYKKCCLPRDQAQRAAEAPPDSDPRPHFARSNSGPGGIYYLPGAADFGYGCWPSISCYRRGETRQQDQLLWAMVHRRQEFKDRKKGLRAAEAELEVAFASPVVLSPEAMAAHFREKGFTPISDFHAAPDWDTDRKAVLGDDYEEPFGETAARADPGLHAMIMATLDEQLADDDPPETRKTLKRLMDEGFPQELCRRLMGLALAIELTDMHIFKKPFDRERFVKNLENLPEVPPPSTSVVAMFGEGE